MGMPRLLWVDLRPSRSEQELPDGLGEYCVPYRVARGEEIGAMIESVSPQVICFDYDCPDPGGLAVLAETKRDFPAIPILMLTEYHSEELAVWALRARVWDYLVKPVSVEDLLRPVGQDARRSEPITRLTPGRGQEVPGQSPPHQVLDKVAFRRPNAAERAVQTAQAYVEQHLDEKIEQTATAALCCMSPSQFSRTFKRSTGVTFSDFVFKTRIKKALELLSDPGAKVTTVCYEVGFQDPSYFARIFRRFTGLNPSEYQEHYSHRQSAETQDPSIVHALVNPRRAEAGAGQDAPQETPVDEQTLPPTAVAGI